MALNVKFEVTGLDAYLERIKEVGNNLDDAIKDAIFQSAVPIFDDIIKGAEKHSHRFSGQVFDSMEMGPITQKGNYIYCEIGMIDDNKGRKGGWHAVFQEYGAPTMPADPFIRPAYDKNRAKIKRIQKEVLAKWGVPNE